MIYVFSKIKKLGAISMAALMTVSTIATEGIFPNNTAMAAEINEIKTQELERISVTVPINGVVQANNENYPTRLANLDSSMETGRTIMVYIAACRGGEVELYLATSATSKKLQSFTTSGPKIHYLTVPNDPVGTQPTSYSLYAINRGNTDVTIGGYMEQI